MMQQRGRQKFWSSLLVTVIAALGLVLGAAVATQAAEKFCTDYGGLIDGDDPLFAAGAPVQITIDDTCTFQNWPRSNPLTTTINFQTNDPSVYLIIFDNVWYDGNMACSNIPHKLWVVNSEEGSFSGTCQNIMIPAETIAKQSPASTAAIGVPFTYTLTLPSMNYPAGDPSNNDLGAIELWDDLDAIYSETGVALSFVKDALNNYDLNAYYKGTTTPVPITVSGDSTDRYLHLAFPNIDAGRQVVIEMKVVLDDTPANVPGLQFSNIATWKFARWIDLDEDGIQDADEYFNPLPGESGISAPMTVVEPDLEVTKSSSTTALNVTDTATFTIDVSNNGGGAAWNTTILDNIPVGMCENDPSASLGAKIVAADGVTLVSSLNQGTDYSLTWNNAPACQLKLTTLDTPAARIDPSQHLIITYQSQLDPGFTNDGATLTNVAGATRWFSGDSSLTGRRQYGPFALTDGTPGVTDFQDNQTVTAALHGYYFEKTVENLNTGLNPAGTAAPGDTLHYRLRLFNVDQTINGITISDELDVVNTFGGEPTHVMLTSGSYSFDPAGGASGTGLMEITGVDVAPGGELVVDFDITLKATLTNGTVVDNQASLSADEDFLATSDDPFTNGVSSPDDPDDQDPTRVTIQTPGPLAKTNTRASAAIGEPFTYRITVPATPVAAPLYDVRILDDLGLSAADMRFVGASVLAGGAWSLINTGSAASLVIEDTATGIDIPANGQALIEITVELDNTTANGSGLLFNNSASYTYNRMNGNAATRTSGSPGATANMTLAEPVLTAAKALRFVSPAGKQPTDPATLGDVLEYTVTMPNSGDSTAFDASIVDSLPANLSLVPGSATASIDGVAIAGFVAEPTALPGGSLAWGERNGDETLDIPAGQSLLLTYQVTVESVTGTDISNSVYLDWTSLDGASAAERTGAGCPNITAPDDYCHGPATVSIASVDNTAISKAVVADSYAETPAGTTDPLVRVGDTVSYDLTLNLQEYTTRSVAVEDALPEGMALESFVINGGAGFSYTLAAQPAAGATGTLRWEFGDITNPPSNDGTPIDPLVIRYVAKILSDAAPVGVPHVAGISRDNLARLSYTNGDPAVYPDRLTATATIEVRQPRMSAISKVDPGSGRLGAGTAADPYQVNLATDLMSFRLASCNEGLAPAYGVVMTDLLAPELDESGLGTNPPLVKIGTATLIAGTDYTYTSPPRGGEMRIALLDGVPVHQGECVTVDYNIGFYTDLTVSKTWSNQARLTEYRSLPLSEPGRLYAPVDSAELWMANLASPEQLLKTLVSPADATIGDEVVYRIAVPAVPMNRALDNMVVTDSLHGALEYAGASAVDGGGAQVPLTDNSVAPGQVNLGIEHIPAGEQVIITLTARVVNNDQASAGVSFANTASYGYDGAPAAISSSSAPLTIVEPSLTLAKSVTNLSDPGAAPNVGDVLRYSVQFTAAGGAGGDSFSDAFDLSLVDSLSLGMTYRSGTASVDGAGNSIAEPTISGDGSSTAQTLIWSPADASADIDVAEGGRVTLTYDVDVLGGVLPGQELSNAVTVRWTGRDGDSVFERTGSGTPAENDYVAGPATTSLRIPLAISFEKSVVNATTNEDTGTNAEPGDILHYTLVLSNESIIALTNATVVDDLAAQFAPGSLRVLSISDPGADSSSSNAVGGVNGTGLVDIRNLTLAAQGDPGDSLTIEFEATLAPVIKSGTAVLNRARLSGDYQTSVTSNETSTLISSAPIFEIWKTSLDISGDPAVLLAGETLRYTLSVRNTGNEDAVNAVLRDYLPANTGYRAGSTTLNGVVVADPSPGVAPLQAGLAVNTPGDPAGYLRADATPGADNAATVTFEVVVDETVMDGLILDNQGFLSAEGAGSGPRPEQPSDDPATPTLLDPTRDVVGKLPLLGAVKTVRIEQDLGSPGIVDPGDVLLYTIEISNFGSSPATGVVLSDQVPANTSYVANSLLLNGVAVGPDGGVLPLIGGLPVRSSDEPGNEIVSVGASAVVAFEVRVDDGVPTGTVISNQGSVACTERPPLPTDADGLPANGYQATIVVVGAAQLVSVTKEVVVVGGGAAVAGGQLEYVIRVTNVGSLPATHVTVSDDLAPLAGQVTYVTGSGSLNGSATGVNYAGSVFSADYASAHGALPPGASAVARLRVQLDETLALGTTIANTGVVHWNDPEQSASASVSLDLGGNPGSGTLNGSIWHDTNLNKLDDSEPYLEGWSVELYGGGQLLTSVLTAADGNYRLNGLVPNLGSSQLYELRFRAPGAGPNTPSLGIADSSYSNGPQQISGISVASGASLQGLNLPITPNGAVYDSVLRVPVAGASLALLNGATGAALPDWCFDDPAQQNQLTARDGFYKFDLNFGDASCAPGGSYYIEVTPPATGYVATPSRIIPPNGEPTDPFSVPACPGSADDAVPATAGFCEVTGSASVPPLSVPARTAGTLYHLNLTLNDTLMPGQSQIFNNHIPIDPELNGAVAITKTASLINVARGELVPYTIRVKNLLAAPLFDIGIVDRFPAGFKYVPGSARLDGAAREPAVNGRELLWGGLELQVNAEHRIQLLLVVGAGVSEGEYVNRAQVISTVSGAAASGEATATVRVVPDPTFDCTDVVGKVFDDRNLNGRQDDGESGLAGVRVATARGLIATADQYGRFHITCAAVPDEDRGGNFILKLDDRSLPSGYRVVSENPRVQRATRGKLLRFNFGATIHRVVSLDLADGVFEPDSTELRLQWRPNLDRLLEVLQQSPAVLRLSYLADVESEGLVRQRLKALKKVIDDRWDRSGGGYRLDIETEVFWRKGWPP